jgi:hypothetical protein
VSTLDGHLSFWDVDTVHTRVEYSSRVLHDTAVHGLCYVRHLDMVFGWSQDKGDHLVYAWDMQSKVTDRPRRHSRRPNV